MILPQQRKWTQSNDSDILSPIDSSFNINLDKYGYVQLSPRKVAVKTHENDANFDLVLAAQRYSGTDYRLWTKDQPFNLGISVSTGIAVTEDTDADNPSGSVVGDGVEWQGRWYVTGSTTLTYKTTTWNAVTLSPTLTASIPHPLCVFGSRNQLMIGNGNQVKQVNTSHVDTVNLALPAEYQVNRIAYGNNRAGICAKNSINEGANGKFYIWDGKGAGAAYDIDLDASQAVDVVFTGGTFLVLSSNGILLKFNGSALVEAARLPFADLGFNWNDGSNNYLGRGRIMFVESDNILININSGVEVYGTKRQTAVDKFYSGVWCYNPTFGLYHRSANSRALAISRNVTTANVNTTTNVITVTATVPRTGTPVKYYSASTVIGGLKNSQVYYTINVSSTTLKLASTKTLALAGTAIDLTGTGDDFQFLAFFPEDDFGHAIGSTAGLVTNFEFDSSLTLHGNMSSQFLVGPAATLTYSLGVQSDDIENRGFITTAKLNTENIKDSYGRLFIKHKPLEQDVDKLVVKYKANDFDPIIAIESSGLLWVDGTSFTVTNSFFSEVRAGDEVEILSGAGAGQRAHITSITLNAGTYTVVLDETIIGVAVSNRSTISIDRWSKLGVTTTSTVSNVAGYSEFLLPNIRSKWIQFKIEMRGVGISLEELQIINSVNKPSV